MLIFRIKEWYEQLSIKARFMFLVLVASIVIVTPIAVASSIAYVNRSFTNAHEVSVTIGQMLSSTYNENCNGKECDISDILNDVNNIPNVMFVAIYDKYSKNIGQWSLPGQEENVPKTRPEADVTPKIGWVINLMPIEDNNDGLMFAIAIDISKDYTGQINKAIICIIIFLFAYLICYYSIYRYIVSIIFDPLATLDRSIDKILVDGDLGVKLETKNHDEIGHLSDNFNSMVELFRYMIVTSQGINVKLEQASNTTADVGSNISKGNNEISSYISSSNENMEGLLVSFNDIVQKMERLSLGANKGMDAISNINQLTQVVGSNVNAMNESLSSSSVLINKVGKAVEESAYNVNELNDYIAETSASMYELERSVNEVEKNAQSSAGLTKQVQNQASVSSDAIKRTTEGIANIRNSSADASNAINNLGRKIGDIGTIVHVIEDITKQTNLLALNAAIIAAGAGEHGRGFSVVSDEIAALAQRTRASTTEIVDLIESIQEESQNAVLAMNQDMRYIDEGVILGEQAETLLQELQGSVAESTHMAELIAVSAVEQSSAIKSVNKSIENISHSIQQINNNLDEQAKGAQQIVSNTQQLNFASKELLNSSTEQSASMTEVVGVISEINKRLQEVKDEQHQRTMETKEAIQSIKAIKDICDKQGAAVNKLGQAMEPIKAMTVNLNKLIGRYHV